MLSGHQSKVGVWVEVVKGDGFSAGKKYLHENEQQQKTTKTMSPTLGNVLYLWA